MHLLRCQRDDAGNVSLELEKDSNASEYAVLSHRWGKAADEVSFDDICTGQASTKRGYAKLLGCCEQALRDGLRYVWVDTCCINKSSSSELSEALVSMYMHYTNSKVCYAFLGDLVSDDSRQSDSGANLASVYWSRGWTLQELIAPSRVKFFDKNWRYVGEKTDDALCPAIERITGISQSILKNPAGVRLVSVAKRMSWAARRQTTKVEDRAYSLMGIFGVYMPPLYGEGNHAFVRLQEAILQTSHDHTIFAWTSPPTAPFPHGYESVSTMLALSPDQFEHSSNFKPLPYSEYLGQVLRYKAQVKAEYGVTNIGLSIRLPIIELDEDGGLYVAFLACNEDNNNVPSGILLRTTSATPRDHFWRTNWDDGPTERGNRSFAEFLKSGRIGMSKIYVLPSFSTISEDSVELGLDGLAVPRRLPRVEGSTQVVNHIPDPRYQEL